MNSDITPWSLEASYATLSRVLFAEADPAIFPAPRLLLYNKALATELGLAGQLDALSLDDRTAYLVGNRYAEGSRPLSQAYAGFQFGHFTILGDGRAVLLGEQIAPSGERYDLQLKGSGRTVYSRRGDGKATLAPMLREYLISEAMNALGVPTTRSLSVALTGEIVRRAKPEQGAVLLRTALSHLRVGTMQYARLINVETLRALADYSIQRHYPSIYNEATPSSEVSYLLLLRRVIERQAKLIAQWMLLGFVHGVMNTDNMTLSGETIDYGPCAFVDHYTPEACFSSIDHEGRYRFGAQPQIGLWNLSRFAESLLPLLHSDESAAITLAEAELHHYSEIYEKAWGEGMQAKLGFATHEADDYTLAQELLDLMQAHRADYPNTFVRLTLESSGADASYLQGTQALWQSERFGSWQGHYQSRLLREGRSPLEIQEQMQSANPYIIPRNYWVEEALHSATEGDMTSLEALLSALQTPYDYTAEVSQYQSYPEQVMLGYQTFCGT